jgi:CBS domain-containing protein
MTVRSILDSKGHQVLSVEPDAKLAAAVKILGEKKIGAVLVMSQGGIEGILSERDIVRVLAERGGHVLEEPVSDVMTRKVVSCRQSDTVAGIMEMMTVGKFRHLPVVEDGKVVGLISIGDIVKRRVQEYETEQEALRDYIKTA